MNEMIEQRPTRREVLPYNGIRVNTQPLCPEFWTRQARTARSGSMRCPTTIRPSSSRRVNVVRSGTENVASGTSRSSDDGGSHASHLEDLDPHPRTDAPPASSTLTNPEPHPL